MTEPYHFFADYDSMTKDELIEIIKQLKQENDSLKQEIEQFQQKKQKKKTYDFSTYFYNYPLEK